MKEKIFLFICFLFIVSSVSALDLPPFKAAILSELAPGPVVSQPIYSDDSISILKAENALATAKTTGGVSLAIMKDAFSESKSASISYTGKMIQVQRIEGERPQLDKRIKATVTLSSDPSKIKLTPGSNYDRYLYLVVELFKYEGNLLINPAGYAIDGVVSADGGMRLPGTSFYVFDLSVPREAGRHLYQVFTPWYSPIAPGMYLARATIVGNCLYNNYSVMAVNLRINEIKIEIENRE